MLIYVSNGSGSPWSWFCSVLTRELVYNLLAVETVLILVPAVYIVLSHLLICLVVKELFILPPILLGVFFHEDLWKYFFVGRPQ